MPWRGERGSSWIESTVVVLVLAVVATLLLGALWRVERATEETAYRMTVLNLRSGLRFRMAAVYVAGGTRAPGEWVGMNPMALLDQPPADYAGELHPTDADRVQPGQWFFDAQRRELVYRFHTGWGRGVREGRLKVIAMRRFVNAAGEAQVEGVTVVEQIVE